MTRREFEEDVSYFGELLSFCWEYNIGEMDDVVSDDERDDEILEYIRDYDGSWTNLRDYLADIPTGYDYYRRTGYIEYEYLDDYDFERYKEAVLAEADERELFEPEEDEEPQEDPEAVIEEAEEARRKEDGYYFTDPMTGEVLVAGYSFSPVVSGELFL